MLKKLSRCIREYKTPTLLSLIFIIGEAVIETLIPYITANLVNQIKGGVVMTALLRTGLILVLLSLVSLGCGGAAGVFCARASAGFARNLRHDVFQRIQSFSFQNIDRFSSASLVTRMTTDISNIQQAYMMLIRTAIRAPLLLIFSTSMAFYMGGSWR